MDRDILPAQLTNSITGYVILGDNDKGHGDDEPVECDCDNPSVIDGGSKGDCFEYCCGFDDFEGIELCDIDITDENITIPENNTINISDNISLDNVSDNSAIPDNTTDDAEEIPVTVFNDVCAMTCIFLEGLNAAEYELIFELGDNVSLYIDNINYSVQELIASEVQIELGKEISCEDDCEDNLVKANALVNMTVWANINHFENGTLKIIYPVLWDVVDPNEGFVSVYDEDNYQIVWKVSAENSSIYSASRTCTFMSPDAEGIYSFKLAFDDFFDNETSIEVYKEEVVTAAKSSGGGGGSRRKDDFQDNIIIDAADDDSDSGGFMYEENESDEEDLIEEDISETLPEENETETTHVTGMASKENKKINYEQMLPAFVLTFIFGFTATALYYWYHGDKIGKKIHKGLPVKKTVKSKIKK